MGWRRRAVRQGRCRACPIRRESKDAAQRVKAFVSAASRGAGERNGRTPPPVAGEGLSPVGSRGRVSGAGGAAGLLAVVGVQQPLAQPQRLRVTSISSSSAMYPIASSSVIARGGSSRMFSSLPLARMFGELLPPWSRSPPCRPGASLAHVIPSYTGVPGSMKKVERSCRCRSP